MTDDILFNQHRAKVLPEWIDYNGHMNVAYYVLAFDHATDTLFDYIGIDAEYRKRTNCSIFVGELHVNYMREVHEGDAFEISTQILDLNERRVQLFHRMVHSDKGYLAATTEIVIVHVDLERRRSTDWVGTPFERLQNMFTDHGKLVWPENAGRQLGIKRR